MSAYKHFYVKEKYRKNNEGIDQLLQLLRITSDGDLIDKEEARELRKRGFAQRYNGYSIITLEGIEFLNKSKIID